MQKYQLPDDVLSIIRDYSKPLTRCDWKTCGKISQTKFNLELKKYIIHEDLFYKCMHTIKIKHMRFWFVTTYGDKNNYRETSLLLI